jgi:hypothetical protein
MSLELLQCYFSFMHEFPNAVSGEWSRFCVSSDKIALEKRTLANSCLQSGPNSLALLLGGWFIKF